MGRAAGESLESSALSTDAHSYATRSCLLHPKERGASYLIEMAYACFRGKPPIKTNLWIREFNWNQDKIVVGERANQPTPLTDEIMREENGIRCAMRLCTACMESCNNTRLLNFTHLH